MCVFQRGKSIFQEYKVGINIDARIFENVVGLSFAREIQIAPDLFVYL